MPNRFPGSTPVIAMVLGLSLVGGPSAQPVDSFGRGVPLGTAIQRIVPEGASVRVEPSSLEERRISWVAGPDWRQVLRRAVQTAGLRYREEAGSVIIDAPPPPAATQPSRAPGSPAPPPVPEAPGAGGLPGDQPLRRDPGFVLSSSPQGGEARGGAAREEARDGPREAGAASSRPAPARPTAAPARQIADAPGVWRVRRGQTLDQVLAEWAERAGWTLVVNTPIIYEMQAGAELRGDFIDAAASLINSIQARPLPRAVFYRGNRVLVVSNSFEVSSP